MKSKAHLAVLTIATQWFVGASQEQSPFAYFIPHDPAIAVWYPGRDVDTINTASESLCAIHCYLRFCVGYRYLGKCVELVSIISILLVLGYCTLFHPKRR